MDFLDNLDTSITVDRMICSQYLVRLKPTFSCLARAAEYQESPIVFEQSFMDELLNWLYCYKNTVYITEREGAIWGFVPTLFPSSAMVLAFKFNVDAGVALRCLSRNEYHDRFEYSLNIKSKKTRSTKIDEAQRHIDCFFEKLNECFFEPYISSDDPEITIRDFEARINCFSKLFGVPVTVEKRTVEKSLKMQGEIDFPLLSAFFITLLLLSREFAINRSVRISFRMLSQSVAAVAEIVADEADFARAVALWEGMCADLFMPFGMFFSSGVLTVGLQPCRRELSYLGLKQQTDWLHI